MWFSLFFLSCEWEILTYKLRLIWIENRATLFVHLNVNLNSIETMLLGASNHCSTTAAAAAVAAASKNGTDFSIAAIMSRGSLSREPSERSLSKYSAPKKVQDYLKPTFSRKHPGRKPLTDSMRKSDSRSLFSFLLLKMVSTAAI